MWRGFLHRYASASVSGVEVKVLFRRFSQTLFVSLSFLALMGCQAEFERTAVPGGGNSVGSPVKLILNGITSPQAGACSAYLVVVQDNDGNSAPVTSNTILLLTKLGSGTFYSDPSCVSPLVTPALAMSSGESSSRFFYKNDVVESDAITVSDSAGALFGTTLNLVIDGVSKLALEGATSIPAQDCVLYRLLSQNVFGDARAVDADLVANLSNTGSGKFYSDASCSTEITSATIPTNFSFAFLYYKNDTVEPVSLRAEDAAGVVSPFDLAVIVDGPTQLVLSGPTPVTAGFCNAYLVETQNPSGASRSVFAPVTVNLSGKGSGEFYKDSLCTDVISSVEIASGSTASFFYANTIKETVSLKAEDSASSLNDGVLAVEVDSATQLSLEGNTNPVAGACTPYEIKSRNTAGDVLPVFTLITVNLADGSAGGLFYPSSDCTDGSQITSIPLLKGNSLATVYYKNLSQGSITLSASDAASVLSAASLNIVLAGAGKLVLLGDTDITADDCVPYTVQSQDLAGNPANVDQNTAIRLTGGGLGAYYQDSLCSQLQTDYVIGAGSNSVQFYFKDTIVDTPTLVASDLSAKLESASLAVNVQAALVASLSISEDPEYDFGSVTTGQSQDHTFTINNSGQAQATAMAEAVSAALASPFGFKDGAYPGTGGTCAGMLDAGDSCTVVLSFSPLAEGDFSDSLFIQYNDGLNDRLLSRLMKGTGVVSPDAGKLDTSFSGDGMIVHNVSGQDVLHGATLQQPDGKIVVAGSTIHPAGDRDFALVRYMADGSLDTSFGSSGLRRTDFGGEDAAFAITQQSDGKIVVVGYSDCTNERGIAIARYTADGNLDSTFGGGDGRVFEVYGSLENDSANAVVIDNSGRILVAGRSDREMLFVRYQSDGSRDTSFGSTGAFTLNVSTGFDSALSLALDSSDRIVAAGYASNASFTTAGVVVVRLNENGSLDSSFAGNGIRITPVSSGFDMGRGVAIDSTGRIVVVGTASNGSNQAFALLRYNENGNLDGGFGGGDGIVLTSMTSGASVAEAVSFQSDGKIVVAGYVDRSAASDLFVVGRYLESGTLDTSFSRDGWATISGGRAHGMTLQSDGKIIAVGESSSGRFVTVRYLP